MNFTIYHSGKVAFKNSAKFEDARQRFHSLDLGGESRKCDAG
jgi:hypothetical protein